MSRKRCPVIGLAGGIGAGKSAVARVFAGLGAVVIDADELAHQVLDREDVKRRIEEQFGPGVVRDGSVCRPALAERVFAEGRLLAALNGIVHPAVIEMTRVVIAGSRRDGTRPAVVLDAPLIFEAGLEGLCDVMVFVEAEDKVRTERLRAARGWDQAEIERRQKFQKLLIYKKQQADYTIDNNGTPEETARQAAEIWEEVVG